MIDSALQTEQLSDADIGTGAGATDVAKSERAIKAYVDANSGVGPKRRQRR